MNYHFLIAIFIGLTIHLKLQFTEKNTFSGLGISNFSFCSNSFKLNSINTLLFKAYGICSNYFHLHNEFNFLINYFKNNGFCSFSVHKQINRFLNTKYLPTVDSSSNNAFKYIVLSYFGPQSDKLKLEVSEILKKYFTAVNFKIISLYKSTIGQFFNFKDKLARAMLSSIIYSFSCERCSSNYVGMTSRNFYKRIAEHAGRIFRTAYLLIAVRRIFDDDVISSTGHRESILLSPINSDQTISGGLADGLSTQCEQRMSGRTRRTQTVHQQQVVRVCVPFSPWQPLYNSRKW